MRVRISVPDGGDPIEREGVRHVHTRENGDLVLRFSDRKETIRDNERRAFEVSDA